MGALHTDGIQVQWTDRTLVEDEFNKAELPKAQASRMLNMILEHTTWSTSIKDLGKYGVGLELYF